MTGLRCGTINHVALRCREIMHFVVAYVLPCVCVLVLCSHDWTICQPWHTRDLDRSKVKDKIILKLCMDISVALNLALISRSRSISKVEVRCLAWSSAYTLPKFWRYNKVLLGELVPLENHVDQNTDFLGQTARVIYTKKFQSYCCWINNPLATLHTCTKCH